MEKTSFPCVDVSNVKALPDVMSEIANGKCLSFLIGFRELNLLKQSQKV